jgi:hypothetical protein
MGCQAALIGLRKELDAPLPRTARFPRVEGDRVPPGKPCLHLRVSPLQFAVKLVEGAEIGFGRGYHNIGIGPVPIDDTA